MENRSTRGVSAPNLAPPYPAGDPRTADNDLPPIPLEELTTPAVETQCERAVEALRTLREMTDKLADPLGLFQTVTLVEAQASSTIEGIVTNVDGMLKHLEKPRRSNGEDPEVDSALRHHDAIIDAWRDLET